MVDERKKRKDIKKKKHEKMANMTDEEKILVNFYF